MSAAGTSFAFYASCAPGLESVLVEELAELGLSVRAVAGGAEGRTGWSGLYSVLHRSRVAESLRVRLKPFAASSFAQLEAGLARLPWHAYVGRNVAVEVRVTCSKSRLYHSDAVAERVHRQLTSALGTVAASAKDEEPGARVYVRLEHDQVQVSIDASGERLHRRGYRTHVVDAPLRETLAGAIARLARRHGAETHLWDPFCGSGTLALEWLALRNGLPTGREHFAIDRWPLRRKDARRLEEGSGDPARPEADALRGSASDQPTRGLVNLEHQHSEATRALLSDLDPKAIDAARHNAGRAGLVEACTFLVGDFEAVVDQVPAGSAIVSNPPYGVRLGTSREATDVVHRLERVLRARPDLSPVLILGPANLVQGSPRWKPLARFPNGGVNVTLHHWSPSPARR